MPNVFEFLGKPSDFRSEKKVVQLVKHWDDVNPKAEQGILHKKVKFPIFGQVKKDGVFCMVVVYNDEVKMFGRTGKKLTSVLGLERTYKALGFKTGVYIGELICDECSLEELSGITSPNRVKPLTEEQEDWVAQLDIGFFDHLTLCEFISGHSSKPYSYRHARLDSLCLEHFATNRHVLGYHIINNQSELDWFANMQIELGEEGAVFKQDVEWLAGAKDWHQMKKVRGVSYDLECIGWEEGSGKYSGKVANLLFRFAKGKTVTAMLGKGWTHEDAENLYYEIQADTEMSPNGKIYRVVGLQPSSKNGLIRLPKVRELRHDKTEADF